MRKAYFLIFIAVICINTIKQVNAQAHTVILSGDTCAGGNLAASFTSGNFAQIKWFNDTTLLTVRQNWQPNGVVVAGSSVGFSASQIYEPLGIFVDKNQNVYVVDDGKQSVTRWARGATTGVVVAGGNGKGTAPNQFFTPVDVVVDANKNVYVSDDLQASVIKWAPGAKKGVVVAGGNGEGSAANQLFGPQGICMDRFGNLYIADRWNDRIQKWAPGATQGVTVAGGNGRGIAANQLDEPISVGVDYAGNVYVTEPDSHSVQKWAPGASSGVTIAGDGVTGTGAAHLSGPGELSVDSAGDVFIIDAGQSVVKWTPGASYGITVAGGYGNVASPSQLDRIGPSFGLFVDANEDIYVSDLFQGRVRKFSRGQINSDSLINAATGNYKVEITTMNGKVFQSPSLHVAGVPAAAPDVTGKVNVNSNQVVKYTVSAYIPGATYTWAASDNAIIQSGQGTPNVTVQWGTTGAYLSVTASSGCGISKTRVKTITVNSSSIANIGSPGSKPVVLLYPNPAANVASIAFTATRQAKYEITVTNMMGKQLLKQQGITNTGKNQVDLDVTQLRRDNYIVNIQYDNNITILKLQKE